MSQKASTNEPFPIFRDSGSQGSDDSFRGALVLTRRMILRKIRIALQQDGYLPSYAMNAVNRSDPAWNQPLIHTKPKK
jgi:hypothetical protein